MCSPITIKINCQCEKNDHEYKLDTDIIGPECVVLNVSEQGIIPEFMIIG